MEQWGSRIGALLALIGGAVGLGNFLRFPFQAAKWGGGAFLIPYFIALVLVGLPLVWIEMGLGRIGRRGTAPSAPRLVGRVGGRPAYLVGLLGVYVSLGIGAYYAYLTGWTLGYAYHAGVGDFRGLSLEAVVDTHKAFLYREGLLWYLVTWAIVGLILYRGLRAGLERVSLYGIPALFLLACGIVVGVLLLGDTGRCDTCSVWAGLAYLYTPRWEALTQPAVWLAATGQVFFSIGVGFGMYPVYAAHAERSHVFREGFVTSLANTVAEVGLGGLLVIPLVTAFLGLPAVQARAGFGMGFEVMPYVLNLWGGSGLIAAWYVLLFLAALTSLLAMGWVGVTWLSGVFGGEPRRWAWPLVGVLALLGLPTVLGYEAGTLDLYDQWLGTLFLVLAALGHWWVFHRWGRWDEIETEAGWRLPAILRVSMRWGTPLFLIALLIGAFFQPAAGDWQAALAHLLTKGSWPWATDSLPLWLWNKLRDSVWNQVGLACLLISGGALVLLSHRGKA